MQPPVEMAFALRSAGPDLALDFFRYCGGIADSRKIPNMMLFMQKSGAPERHLEGRTGQDAREFPSALYGAFSAPAGAKRLQSPGLNSHSVFERSEAKGMRNLNWRIHGNYWAAYLGPEIPVATVFEAGGQYWVNANDSWSRRTETFKGALKFAQLAVGKSREEAEKIYWEHVAETDNPAAYLARKDASMKL